MGRDAWGLQWLAGCYSGAEAAERGDLVVLLAGSKAAVDRLCPVFTAFSREIHVIDEYPAKANSLKLAGNFLLAAVIEVLGEAYAFVDRYGIAESRFLDIVNGSLFRSAVIAAYGEKISREAFDPAGFRLSLGFKDIRLALEAGEAKALAMPIASVLRDRFLEAIDAGLQDVDWSAVARAGRRKARSS